MCCILRVGGQDLDIDAFLKKSKLEPYKKSYRGQPRLKIKPSGEKLLESLFAIETSDADSDNLGKQIADTIAYLKNNQDKLRHISLTKEVQYAVLDFAVDLRIDRKGILIQSETFPSELIRLAGNLGLDIEFSLYPVDLQTILENNSSRKNLNEL